MHNSQDIANKIKSVVKLRHTTIGKMLSECDLSKNALSTMQSGGYLPRTETIVKIADYLDCSVDYLLGRSEISGSSYLTEEEKQFLQAYNAHPEYHAAVKAMLGIDNTDDIKLAAQKKPVKPITD